MFLVAVLIRSRALTVNMQCMPFSRIPSSCHPHLIGGNAVRERVGSIHNLPSSSSSRLAFSLHFQIPLYLSPFSSSTFPPPNPHLESEFHLGCSLQSLPALSHKRFSPPFSTPFSFCVRPARDFSEQYPQSVPP